MRGSIIGWREAIYNIVNMVLAGTVIATIDNIVL